MIRHVFFAVSISLCVFLFPVQVISMTSEQFSGKIRDLFLQNASRQ